MTIAGIVPSVEKAAAYAASLEFGPRPAVLIPLADGRCYVVSGASALKVWRTQAEAWQGEDRRLLDEAIAKLLPEVPA